MQGIVIIKTLLLVALLCGSAPARGGTSGDAQLAGRLGSITRAFIIGEFGGRTLANPHSHQRPICQPSDYDDLLKAAEDNATLIAFWARCRLIQIETDRLHVQALAFLPLGYCERIKETIDATLAEHIYSWPANEQLPSMALEYKNILIDQSGAYWSSIRSARLTTSCQADGVLRVSAPRFWQQPRMRAQPLSARLVFSLFLGNLASFAVLWGLVIGFAADRWKWPLPAVVIATALDHLFTGFIIALTGGGSSPTDVFWIYVLTNFVAYLAWASLFFLLKGPYRRWLEALAEKRDRECAQNRYGG